MIVRRHQATVAAAAASCLVLVLAAACANADRGGSASPSAAAAPAGFSSDEQSRIADAQPHVRAAAIKYKVDPDLINAVIWVESKHNAKARGPGGAAGYMQLMPSTARGLAKQMGERSRPYSPDFNVRAGTYYLARMISKFDGNERLGIAAYNAGPGNVRKWQKAGSGLPTQSQKYVAKVLEAKQRFASK
ncbi:MAG: lytic transglycosylase domain-containing protein [Nannocystaceae bacterium]